MEVALRSKNLFRFNYDGRVNINFVKKWYFDFVDYCYIAKKKKKVLCNLKVKLLFKQQQFFYIKKNLHVCN